jgi:MYXO-CTERM domain-containing protein
MLLILVVNERHDSNISHSQHQDTCWSTWKKEIQMQKIRDVAIAALLAAGLMIPGVAFAQTNAGGGTTTTQAGTGTTGTGTTGTTATPATTGTGATTPVAGTDGTPVNNGGGGGGWWGLLGLLGLFGLAGRRRATVAGTGTTTRTM